MRLSDYNTPLSGMLAAQMGLQTTKQNLSNIHTAMEKEVKIVISKKEIKTCSRRY